MARAGVDDRGPREQVCVRRFDSLPVRAGTHRHAAVHVGTGLQPSSTGRLSDRCPPAHGDTTGGIWRTGHAALHCHHRGARWLVAPEHVVHDAVADIDVLVDRSRHPLHSLLAVVAFSLGGSLVEYWWPGLLLGLACWGYCKQASSFRLILVFVAAGALWPVNHNYWAMAFLPFLLLAPRVRLTCPRNLHLFYVYYPAHLTALWAFISLSANHA